MITHEGYNNLQLGNPVVTLGIFDGVHRGHRSLLDTLVLRAKESNGESAVITFHPHPKLVLDQNKANLSFLTTMQEKVSLLDNAGIDHLIIIEFTKEFSRIEACEFIKEILVNKIGTKHLILGYNHHFGRSGKGDFKTIKQCTESGDFTVEQVQGLHTEEGAISSSSIREALLSGRIEDANNWLGYNYSLRGTIVKGKQIGRAIGFPTANIKPDDPYKLIPENGVYAVEVVLDRNIYPGMMSIGTNPTVNTDVMISSLEVNILNFDMDIYGRNIKVIFRKRLRDEMTFENTAKLAEQINLDKLQVLAILT